MENIAEYIESLRQKDLAGVPVTPTIRLIHYPYLQPLIKKGLRPPLKKQLIKEINLPSANRVDPRFFELDLREERYKDYPDGWLTILKQSDNVNHACFKIGDDIWVENWDYLRNDEILCALVDQKDWQTVTGYVIVELADCVFEAGRIVDNDLTRINSLTIHRRNPHHNYITYNPANIVKIWKVKTLTSRKAY